MVIAIITVWFESKNTQSGEESGHSRFVGTIPRRRGILDKWRGTRRGSYGKSGRRTVDHEIHWLLYGKLKRRGVVLYRNDEETVALSFKLDFLCSNNTVEYEAYLMGLAMALEMGIKHLRVIGDSYLVGCQAKGSFSLKEPTLALYRTLAQRM